MVNNKCKTKDCNRQAVDGEQLCYKCLKKTVTEAKNAYNKAVLKTLDNYFRTDYFLGGDFKCKISWKMVEAKVYNRGRNIRILNWLSGLLEFRCTHTITKDITHIKMVQAIHYLKMNYPEYMYDAFMIKLGCLMVKLPNKEVYRQFQKNVWFNIVEVYNPSKGYNYYLNVTSSFKCKNGNCQTGLANYYKNYNRCLLVIARYLDLIKED